MSRKRSAPKKLPVIDPIYKSVIIPKLVNSIMYDGKKTVAEKIVYEAIDKIKSAAKQTITADQLKKAKEYVAAGGSITAIESKYKITDEQRKNITKA